MLLPRLQIWQCDESTFHGQIVEAIGDPANTVATQDIAGNCFASQRT